MVHGRGQAMRSIRICGKSLAQHATSRAYALVLGLGVSVSLLHPSASLAGTFTTFGETFQRAAGAPVTVTRSFSVPNPSTTYTLRVDNGGFPAGQFCRVSSAMVDVIARIPRHGCRSTRSCRGPPPSLYRCFDFSRWT